MINIKLLSLFRSAGIYAFAGILNSAIPFFLLPVFTRYLDPSAYGIVATFQILISLLVPFAGLSINGAIAVQYYHKSDVDLPTYIANCLIILLISATAVAMTLWAMAESFSALSLFPKEWLWSVVAIATGQFIIQIALSMWQIQVKPIAYGTFQIVQTATNVLLSLYFIVFMHMSWQGRVLAQVCCDVSFAIFAFLILYKNGWIRFSFNFSYIRSATRYGVPLIPHALAGWAMTAVDRLFINRMVGIADTGLYTVGYQIATIIALIEVAFNNAWVPWLFEHLSNGNHVDRVKIVKITYLYVAAMILLALGISIFAPWFMKYLVGKSFRGSIQFIFWIAIGKGLYSMYFMTCNYILYTKKTAYLVVATFSSAVVHVLSIYYLIKINGAIGAAQAGIISTFVLVGLTWYLANRVYPMPWRLGGERALT